MNTKRLLTWVLAVTMALVGTNCQNNEDEVPVSQTPIGQDDGNDGQNGNTGDPDDANAGSEFGSSLVAVYSVSGKDISLARSGDAADGFYNSARQQEFWKFYTDLIPSDMWPQLTRLVLYADDQDGTAAYVAPINENNLSHWEMGWNLAYVWSGGQLIKGETAYTAIHEFAHILTLNAGQVNVSSSACNTFHTGEGCSNGNSYINGFFQNFWTDIIEEHRNLNTDDEYFEFYEKYRNRFVSEYAATNPGEDIAETFTIFVINDLPTGNSIAEQKVRYLYEFDELVTMRQRIRDNINFNIDLGAVGEARSERAGKHQSHNHF